MVQPVGPGDDWAGDAPTLPSPASGGGRKTNALRMKTGVAQPERDGRPSGSQRQVDHWRPRSAFRERDARRLVAEHPGLEGPDPIDKRGDPLDPMLGNQRRPPEPGHQPG